MTRIFGLLFVVCLAVYIVAWCAVMATAMGTFGLVAAPSWATIVMVPAGWGTSIFFILFIVMLVLRR